MLSKLVIQPTIQKQVAYLMCKWVSVTSLSALRSLSFLVLQLQKYDEANCFIHHSSPISPPHAIFDGFLVES